MKPEPHPPAISLLLTALALVCLALSVRAADSNTSELWGKSGERWTPQSRLPDFSFAGYRAGERPIPTVTATANLKDFGAVGDGKADDTPAFRQAIARTASGAIEIPSGRYLITGILEIKKPNLVLRGAGPESTVICFRKPMAEILGKAPYADGLLRISGERNGSRVAGAVAGAKRGDRRLQLSSTTGLRAGQQVRLRMTNPADNSLGRHLCADQGGLNAERQQWNDRHVLDWIAPIESLDQKSIVLARPLRMEVRLDWQPEIWSFQPTVYEVGVEDLSIEFPAVQYPGHHKEEGYFGLYLKQAFNCWVRNVAIVDADIGVYLNGSGNCTVSGVVLKAGQRAEDKADGATGHYAFGMNGCGTQDNLITDCQLLTPFVHNLAVASFASGNVYSRIASKTGRCDHHAGAPHENLYTDILIRERASDLFKCGGNRADEPNSGARTTFWNIRAARRDFPSRIPTLPDGKPKFPQANFIGVDQWTPTRTADREWIERWPGETTEPPNLHEAQLARRLAAKSPPKQ